ncbi:hypothetical protein PV371_36665 [Streptomyces sp. TX20-6-3]|uniref:hypothetical protein n=1 Tax=Streptomyces sp. TX20-6-3 TaxID=3028705 RepID=UPI0029B32BDF|nr:hypothetical protein [Streptomyces sp. TX20-6-3]MDX2565158.1 hypothetical protein [Streptomyces sp. TX20-6-3]
MSTAPNLGRHIPPMPERSAKALRAAIAKHTPELLDGFDLNWETAINKPHDLAPQHAFMARWWVEFAIARDPELDRQVTELEARAAEAADKDTAMALLEQASHLRREAGKAEPGQ